MNIKISKILLGFFLILLFGVYILSIHTNQNILFSSVVLGIDFLAFGLYFIQREPIHNIRKQYIRIVPLFLLGYFIVFFQLHLDYILGNINESYTRYWVDSLIVPESLTLSSIGFVAFLFGYTLKKEKKQKVVLSKIQKHTYPTIGYNFLSFLFLAICLATINPLYLYGGYGNYEMGSISRYFSILFELSVTASLIQHISNLNLEGHNKIQLIAYIKSLGLFQLSLLLIYFFVIIISGDRGPIIYLSIGVMASYIILTKWKLSKLKFVVLGLIASIFIAGLSVIRNSEDNSEPIINRVYEAIVVGHKPSVSMEGINSVSNSTLELSTSIRTLHNAVHNVPNEHPYFLGQFQFLQVVTIIPFGLNVAQVIFEFKNYELTSAKYVSFLVGDDNGAEGTSCVADLYLDFGVLGVFFGLCFFGYYVRLIEIKSLNEDFPSLWVLISFIVISQYAIYIPRATILFNLRNIIWIILIIKFVQFFSNKKTFFLNDEGNYLQR